MHEAAELGQPAPRVEGAVRMVKARSQGGCGSRGGFSTVTRVAAGPELNVAPGSIVVVRDEEWLVTSAERGSDGWLVQVQGLSELVAGTSASFYSSLDTI